MTSLDIHFLEWQGVLESMNNLLILKTNMSKDKKNVSFLVIIFFRKKSFMQNLQKLPAEGTETLYMQNSLLALIT